jgi:phage terminase Nu1 subunit (DNA packaging protein)
MISELDFGGNEEDAEKNAIFRCSSLGDLMSSGRGATKDEKMRKISAEITTISNKIIADEAAGKGGHKINENRRIKIAAMQAEFMQLENEQQSIDEILGDSAKSAIKSVILRRMFGCLEQVETDATRHGIEHEPLAVMQYGELIGLNVGNEHAQFRKNMERKNVGLLTGEADVVFSDAIFEFKCPFGSASYINQCLHANPNYLLQVQGYMHLWDLEKAYIVTCFFKNKNHKSEKVFENTPRMLRFHTNEVQRCEDTITSILRRLELCKEWLDINEQKIRKNAGFYKYKDLRQMYKGN